MEAKDHDYDDIPGRGASLGKILNIMFPPSYIELHHRPPNSVCSLLNTRCCSKSEQVKLRDLRYEVSTEPSSRASFISLRENLNSSLMEHQAKPVGLCPIRRVIFDQCFGKSRFF